MFHTIIVGGGLAGLQVAEELAKRGDQVLLLERYPAFGGRALTFRGDHGLQYEIGAGRIFHTHKRVAALVKRFHLHTFPITTETIFQAEGHEPVANPFNALFEPLRAQLARLPKHVLATHTIAELVPSTFHPIFAAYPYWAEIHMLRADIALPLFEPKETMGIESSSAYYGIIEGIDMLATGLVSAAATAGAMLKNRHRVHDIQKGEDGLFVVHGDYGKKVEAKPFVYKSHRVVIATCRCSLSDFSVLKGMPLLKQVGTSALMRIYAVFPKHPRTHKVWFADLPKTITAGPLRYIIPIDAKKGLIMISYTDGKDTDVWRPLDDKTLKTAIMTEVHALFPDKKIPMPSYLAKHDWTSGCSYWLPGTYDVEKASKEAHNPSPGVYVCGESISLHQTWMEGALESAETLLSMLIE